VSARHDPGGERQVNVVLLEGNRTPRTAKAEAPAKPSPLKVELGDGRLTANQNHDKR
jgi:hypothetical protein